jgi:hypothetical protein
VMLTATTNPGYSFDHWSGEVRLLSSQIQFSNILSRVS